MAIKNTALTTTGATTLYTSSGSNAIVTIILCNIGTPDPADEAVDSCTIDLYAVKSGESADTSTQTYGNKIVSNLTVPAGETVFFSDEKIILENGDFIVAVASVSNLLSVTVSTLTV
jgi:hypothetical protein